MVPDFVPGLCPVRLENSEESMYILYIVVGGYVKYLYAQKDWIGLPVNHLVAGSNPAAGAIFYPQNRKIATFLRPLRFDPGKRFFMKQHTNSLRYRTD